MQISWKLQLVALGFFMLMGCSGAGNDDDDASGGSENNGAGLNIQTSASGLTASNLILPATLPASVTQKQIDQISSAIQQTPACQKLSGAAVPLVLAQICLVYQQYYLYPQNLPKSLDNLNTPENYIGVPQKTDPYTFYIEPKQYQEELLPTLEGSRSTVGLRLSLASTDQIIRSETPLTVASVAAFSHAWFDGFRANDQIISIDKTTSLNGLTGEQAFQLFPTKEGQESTFVVKRGGSLITIQTASAEAFGILRPDNILYLRVNQFTETTGTRIVSEFQRLTASTTVTQFILDLRQDPGGSVAGALSLADVLINQDTPANTNPILIMNGTVLKNKAYYLGTETTNLGTFNPQNFVVLVDKGSASSSEIVSAALQYYRSGLLMGTTTYGKGVSQSVVDLIDGSGAIVTSHDMLPPGKVSYHKTGLAPDQTVTGTPTQDNDPQLQAAVQWLKTGKVAQNLVALPTDEKLQRQALEAGNPWLERLLEEWY